MRLPSFFPKILRMSIPKPQPNPIPTVNNFDTVILADHEADQLHIGETCLQNPNSRQLSIIIGGTPSSWEYQPVNVLLTITRNGRPLYDGVKTSIKQLIPLYSEHLPPSSDILPEISGYLSTSCKLAAGDTVYPYTLEDEAYAVTDITIVAPGLQIIKGVLI